MNIEQDIDFELTRMRKLAWRMDALFFIPGTNIGLGLDNLVGLVPVVGDIAAMLPSAWMIHRAQQLGASPGTLAYMIINTIIDFAVGTIPVVGDLFDALYNANIRNYRALERDLNRKTAASKPIYSTFGTEVALT